MNSANILHCCTLFLMLALTGCQPNSMQYQSFVFGTLVDIQIDDVSEKTAIAASNEIFKRYQELHQQLHAWQSGGEIAKLNAAIYRGQHQIIVSAELAAILKQVQFLSQKSDGLFDPAIGRLVALWGFHRDRYTPVQVNQQAVNAIMKHRPSMRDITMHDDHIVQSLNNMTQIDLGGYAKGYALDEGIKILKRYGIHNALINIGGNIIALGRHHTRPWRVGIQHPRKPGTLAVLDLDDGWAIGTSGDYQRFYIYKNKRYCHILDPRTGEPASQTESATVLISPRQNAGVLSDVASKPLFIAPALATTMANQLDITAWLIVDRTGKIRLNQTMQKHLIWSHPEVVKNALVLP